MRTMFFCILLILASPFGLVAQCPDSSAQVPQLHGVVVRSVVSQDPGTKIFTYRFSVRHDNTSIGCITQFQIDITYPPGRDSLPSTGLVDYPRYVIRNLGSSTAVTLIPIGVPTLPSYNGIPSAWDAIVSRQGYVSWGSTFNETEIPPGGQLANLTITSYGLPSIRSYLIKPKYNPPPVDEGQVTKESFDSLRTTTSSLAQGGFTIGPMARPFPFDSLKFLDTLKSYTSRSLSLGWITSSTVATKYNTLFDTIKAQIQRGSGQAARIALDSVIANCNRDSSGAVTSEAYALLRFNSQYLKSHLPTIVDSSPMDVSWNLVSVPVEVADPRKTTLYPNATSPAFGYLSGTGYGVRDTLVNGNGYWVKHGTNATLNFTGLKIDFLRVPVLSGWNLIGAISYDLPKSLVATDSTTSLTSNYFGYKAGVGYFVADTLKEGRGYWIKVSANGNILFNRPSVPSQPPPVQPPPNPDAPPTPTLLSPSNGSSNQPLTVTLSWDASESATSFELQVATVADFSSLVYDNANITTTSQEIGGLAYSTTYYWRVDASNNSGTSWWPGAWWFSTQAQPPPPCNCCIASVSQLDQLTITDAAGNAQSIYVNNSGRHLTLRASDLDMPPAPTGNGFDARFQSNKFIETVQANKGITAIPIVVKNAKLPITIRWKASLNNRMQYWLTTSGKQKSTLLSNSGSTVLSSLGTGIILIQAQASQPPPCDQ